METDTRTKILSAAREIFSRKGFAAARMQEIADHAEINKGLLHYYFKSKQLLFRAVFFDAFHEFSPKLNKIFDADLPVFDKIEVLVDEYMDTLISNPYIPVFIINELNTNPLSFVEEILKQRDRPQPVKFIMQVQLEANAGKIRPIDPIQLIVNIISMCAFPFIARPLFQSLLGVDKDTYMQYMQMRKKEITDFIFHSIKLIDDERLQK